MAEGARSVLGGPSPLGGLFLCGVERLGYCGEVPLSNSHSALYELQCDMLSDVEAHFKQKEKKS